MATADGRIRQVSVGWVCFGLGFDTMMGFNMLCLSSCCYRTIGISVAWGNFTLRLSVIIRKTREAFLPKSWNEYWVLLQKIFWIAFSRFVIIWTYFFFFPVNKWTLGDAAFLPKLENNVGKNAKYLKFCHFLWHKRWGEIVLVNRYSSSILLLHIK